MTGNPIRRRTVLGGIAGGAAVLGLGAPASAGRPGPGDLVAFRRDLHNHPEGPGNEARTAGLVAERLRAAGLAVTTGVGGHGVVGVLRGARRGRTVAYRADMDAVPPNGQIGGGGTAPAHMCGHDLHTTIGVGVAESLARRRRQLAGTVMFVFQPAEETLAGARAMLAQGLFEGAFGGVRPAEIHALHCGPWPVGQFVVMPGFGMPGQDRGTVTLTGPGAEARATALAAEIAALGTVRRPEGLADLENLVAEMQKPNGPLAKFVFMNAAAAGNEVRVVSRCWPENRYREIRAAVATLAGSHGPATVNFPTDPFPAMVCPERENRELRSFLRRNLGEKRVATLHAAIPFNGEDYSLYLNQIPGTYSFLGVQKPGDPLDTAYPHYPGFEPDERAIAVGVQTMSKWLTQRT